MTTQDDLRAAAQLRRNVVIHDNPDFVGEWIAVPREDFDNLRAALAATPEPDGLPLDVPFVSPEVRERMQRYETGRNDVLSGQDGYHIAATDRTVLISEIDRVAARLSKEPTR